jgi:BCD family chlorophyll transporter-like MFS transporter
MGTFAFNMEDILLEPYGGEVLNMSVSETTWLTATLCVGGLLGFAWASRVLGRGADPYRMSWAGVLLGIPAFMAVIASGYLHMPWLFSLGVLLIGLGGGLFGHGTLTSCMNLAPKEQSGLALGAWGAVQATSAGLAMALGGVARDVVNLMTDGDMGYVSVYGFEILMLILTAYVLYPLVGQSKMGLPAAQNVN